jgi:acetamidase/formamidase
MNHPKRERSQSRNSFRGAREILRIRQQQISRRTHRQHKKEWLVKVSSSGFLTFATSLLVFTDVQSATNAAYLTGRWEVTTTYPGGSLVAGLDLAVEAGTYTGKSGYLVPDHYWYKYSGTVQNDGLHLQILTPDGESGVGSLVLTVHGVKLSGRGVIHDVPVTLSGQRPPQRPANAPTVHDFTPQVYYTTFSGGYPPALHLFPGDTVRTKTVDSSGRGENAAQHTLPGNPQTGPFYIEGAMIGDTIAVHFNKIRPNRDTADQYRAALDPHVLPPGYAQEPNADWSNVWKLDRGQGTATPERPSERLKNFTVKLVPMLGCVAVAPYWKQAIGTSDLGPFGGNLDYNGIREGMTLYLPVYQAGAMLSMGDGHAQQGDGEITGSGFETSMDVEFTVDLIQNQLLDQPWAENDEYIMVSGIGGSLNQALQNATAGLSNWLKSYYRLSASEIATVLAPSIQYDIAEVADPQAHVVAKIRKDVLSQIPKPPPPTSVFCRPQWGCRLE